MAWPTKYGSPLRGRGTRYSLAGRAQIGRFTSAWAGNTLVGEALFIIIFTIVKEPTNAPYGIW